MPLHPIVQADLYELLSHLGVCPVWSALLAGFAAHDWWGQLHVTSSGIEYLRGRDHG